MLQRVQRMATKDARALAIRQEVLNAIDNLETSWQRILAARLEVILAARTFEAEQRQWVDRGRISHAPRLFGAVCCASMETVKIRVGYGLGVRTKLNDTGFIEVVEGFSPPI